MVDQSINAQPGKPRDSMLSLYPENVIEYHQQIRKNGLALRTRQDNWKANERVQKDACTAGLSEYGVCLAKSDILTAFSGLLASAELRFEDEHSIEEAFFAWKDAPADCADCLIGARHRALGCRATASFDAKAAKLPGFIAA